jgi:hypothetical protein
LDDTGFGHLSSFGGLVETPNMDKLAKDGLRYNNRPPYAHRRGPRSWRGGIIIGSGWDLTP